MRSSRRRAYEWRANQLDVSPVSSFSGEFDRNVGVFAGRSSSVKREREVVCSASGVARIKADRSYPWNRDCAVPCIGKRPRLFEVAGNVEGRQKRRRVCTKPLLWSQRLIRLGHDPTERYQGWTCLMKAAEDGNESIMSHLPLENADFNCSEQERTNRYELRCKSIVQSSQ